MLRGCKKGHSSKVSVVLCGEWLEVTALHSLPL
jgi:hypothetical protein